MGDSGESRSQRTDENGAMRQVAGGGAAAVLLSIVIIGIGGAPAHAGGPGHGSGGPKYTFTTVLDSQRDGLAPTRCAAINTLGTVAVTVRDDGPASPRSSPSGAQRCSRGRRRHPVGGGLPDPLRQRLQQPALRSVDQREGRGGLPGEPPAADHAGGLRHAGAAPAAAGRVPRPGGAAHHDRAHDQSARRGLHLRVPRRRPVGQHVRQGRVRSRAGRDLRSGLFVGSRNGTFDQRFLADHPTPDGFDFNNLSSRVSLNERGQIAFESGLNDRPVGGIFLSEPDGTFRTIVDNTGAVRLRGRPVAEHLRPRGVHGGPLRRELQPDLQHQHEPRRSRDHGGGEQPRRIRVLPRAVPERPRRRRLHGGRAAGSGRLRHVPGSVHRDPIRSRTRCCRRATSTKA